VSARTGGAAGPPRGPAPGRHRQLCARPAWSHPLLCSASTGPPTEALGAQTHAPPRSPRPAAAAGRRTSCRATACTRQCGSTSSAGEGQYFRVRVAGPGPQAWGPRFNADQKASSHRPAGAAWRACRRGWGLPQSRPALLGPSPKVERPCSNRRISINQHPTAGATAAGAATAPGQPSGVVRHRRAVGPRGLPPPHAGRPRSAPAAAAAGGARQCARCGSARRGRAAAGRLGAGRICGVCGSARRGAVVLLAAGSGGRV
jgi:hypothetical protein